MKLRDLIERMTDGAAHVILIKEDTGEVLLSTVWYKHIDEEYLDMEVKHICVRDYELRIQIE